MPLSALLTLFKWLGGVPGIIIKFSRPTLVFLFDARHASIPFTAILVVLRTRHPAAPIVRLLSLRNRRRERRWRRILRNRRRERR